MPNHTERIRAAYERTQVAFAKLTEASEKMKAQQPSAIGADAAFSQAEAEWKAAYKEFTDAAAEYGQLL